jgi:hypothetical protein
MATLLDSLQGLMTPQNVNAVSNAVGLDPQMVQQGMNVLGPTVLSGLANTASTPTGAQDLMNSLPQDGGDQLMGNLMGMLGGGGQSGGGSGDMLSGLMGMLGGGGGGGAPAGGGNDMLTTLLGVGVGAVAGTISKKMGFNVRPLMMMAIPVVVSMISKQAKEQRLDATGVSRLVQDESKAFLDDPANAEIAGTVRSALQAGDQAAALRKAYSDAEWQKVHLAPLAAAYLVITASPSGGTGQMQELAAAIGSVGEALEIASPVSIIGTAFGTGLSKAEVDTLMKDKPPKEQVLSSIREGVAAVSAKNPGDAEAFRALILDVAQRVAQASKEGGFLGFGGKQVSNEEQQAIDEIHAAVS